MGARSKGEGVVPGCTASLFVTLADVKFTQYFLSMRQRPDRALIDQEWIQYVIDHPEREVIQADGRIRRWASIVDAGDRYLRAILLPDGETVRNAFFDRRFVP
jgi:hypothetical protein